MEYKINKRNDCIVLMSRRDKMLVENITASGTGIPLGMPCRRDAINRVSTETILFLTDSTNMPFLRNSNEGVYEDVTVL